MISCGPPRVRLKFLNQYKKEKEKTKQVLTMHLYVIKNKFNWKLKG